MLKQDANFSKQKFVYDLISVIHRVVTDNYGLLVLRVRWLFNWLGEKV